MSELQRKVLSALYASDSPLSGEELSKLLDVSRASIWKAVKVLQKNGYKITSHHAVGYSLSASDKLFEEGIRLSFDCTVSVFDSIDSTSLEAKKTFSGTPLLVLASTQTAGKGRRNSAFPSPLLGLYFTLALPTRLPLQNLPALKEKLLDTIASHFGVERIDHALMSGEEKVGGVLLEIGLEYDDVTALFIGVGYHPFVDDKLKSVSNLSDQLYQIVNPS